MSLIEYNGESKVIKRICELLDTMSGINFEVVQTLPLVDISTSTIYLVPKQSAEVDNIYDEYINTDGTSQGWELIGTTEIDLTNYVQFSDLSTVATSGDYDDLIDKPTIPTVNDGTLTIQLNGENQQTFTANSSTNKTANIKAVDWVSNGKLGAKNLIPIPYDDYDRTANGVTFKINSDGSVSLSGTASANTNFWLRTYANTKLLDDFWLPDGNYIVSGGYSNTIRLAFCYYQNTTWKSQTNVDQTEQAITVDSSSATYNRIAICISITSGTNTNGVTVYPMIRLASDSDSIWKPYAKTNVELTQDKYETSIASVLGAKNFVPYPYHHPYCDESYVIRDITYTEENGIISVSGTCNNTGNSYCQISKYSQNYGTGYHEEAKTIELKAGKYVLTGAISENVYLQLSYYSKTDSASTPSLTVIGYDYGNGLEFSVSEQLSNDNYFTLFAGVKKNYATQGEKIKPMIKYASDMDSNFQPYAMSNKELTEAVQEHRLVNENLNSIVKNGYYLGSNGNTCTNKPTGVGQFGLFVIKTAESSLCLKQALTMPNGTEYVRYCNGGTWGNWTQL